MKKQITAAVLCCVLSVALAGTAIGQPAPADSAAVPVQKDETVYVSLDAAGHRQAIDVVSRIDTPQSGAYTDYGAYEKITNLSNDKAPQVDGDKITWQLDADAAGFYYQGRMKDGQPPFLFTVAYFLDGSATPPEALQGKSGRATIQIDAAANGQAAAYFAKNYFCQVQAVLDLDQCHNITTPGAAAILSGRSQNLGYTVLPGKTTRITLSFDTQGFSFDGITVTAMPFDQQSMTGIDTGDIKGDIAKMSDGVQELVDGTKELKSGLADLSDGLEDLASGAKSARDGTSKYRTGLKSFTGGVGTLSGKASQIAAGLKKLAANGQGLKSGYVQLSAALDTTLQQLSQAVPPEQAAGMEALRGQLKGYQQGLDAYVAGVNDLSDGMAAFAKGMKQLDQSGGKLLPGLTTIVNGMGKLADGLSKTAAETAKLPGEVQKLVDGQTELKDGVAQANDMFDKWDFGTEDGAAPVSFVSPENAPKSVQFIYKTEAIGADTAEDEPAPQAEQDAKGFLQKFADLFR